MHDVPGGVDTNQSSHVHNGLACLSKMAELDMSAQQSAPAWLGFRVPQNRGQVIYVASLGLLPTDVQILCGHQGSCLTLHATVLHQG